MNKKGTTIFFMLMVGIIFFLLGLALAAGLQDTTTDSLSQLNCTSNYLTNDSVTDVNKANCTAMDMQMPLYVGVLFGLAGMILVRAAL